MIYKLQVFESQVSDKGEIIKDKNQAVEFLKFLAILVLVFLIIKFISK